METREEMKKITLATMKFMYFFTAFFVLFSNYAYAYIDPSAVTYVIQAVAGIFIALGAAITIFRHKIFSFLKKKKKNEETVEDKIEIKDIEE